MGTPSLPVVAELRVRSTDTTRVWHCVGCGCANGIEFTVLGPGGGKVWLRDPRAAPPGVYTVIACISHAAGMSGEWGPLDRRTTFAWQP